MVPPNKDVDGPKRKRKQTAQRAIPRVLLLLVIIAGLLCLILLLLPGGAGRGAVQPNKHVVSGKEPEVAARPTTSVGTRASGTARPAPVIKGRLCIIIDDVGYNLDQLAPFLSFDQPLTFAILPRLRYSTEAADLIHKAGKEIILHQPMEPEGNENPGPGEIYTSMSPQTIEQIVGENLSSIPYVEGLNNHMGSKATADYKTLASVLKVVAARKLFFVDSLTTEHSVGAEVAADLHVPFVARNSEFLDNSTSMDAIKKTFADGLSIAAEKGYAVMIGHVHSKALAELLHQMAPELIQEGYVFTGISEIIAEGEKG